MKDQEHPDKKGITRRNFVKGAALSAAAFTIVPRHVLGRGFKAPSDTLNIAGVGVGGMGRANLLNMSGENIVALCDVDWDYTGKAFEKLDQDLTTAQKRLSEAANDDDRKRITAQMDNFKRLKEQFPKAKRHVDYRKMLEEQKDIDAVMVATPDHTHAIITLDSMKMGKHVYVQKPLTYTVHEARELTKAAKKYPKLVTQMGNQGHSSDDARKINEWIADGAIGKVSEVHIWTNRPIWPQGIPRPESSETVPDTLNWELFLGPAPMRPYHSAYHPFRWRGWVDFGVSAIGDMGAHLVDHPYWALQLNAPSTITATSTPFGPNGTDRNSKDSHPLSSFITYEFPARGSMPPVKMYWYDGGLMPPRPDELADGEVLPKGGGVLMIGDKGKLLHETYGSNPRLLPASRMESYKQPKPTIPRIETSHEMNWVNAIKNNTKATSDFAYAGPLTETMLLGVVATMVPGLKLKWDAANMRITNVPEANQFLKRDYRQGWTLASL